MGEIRKPSMKTWAAIFLIIFIAIGVAMLPQLNEYGKESVISATENEFMYEKSIHILVMLLIGFGFLMVFVRKYGYTSITATYLAVAVSLPLYMLVRPYLWGPAADISITNISMLLFAEFANASLAGGVAIGATVANVTPGWSMLIGLMAGAISVIGYTIIQPRLQKATGRVDTCGVHNLHGMPGIFGGLIALGLVASPMWQIAGVIISVVLALTMGTIVGFIASRLGRKEIPYDDKE